MSTDSHFTSRLPMKRMAADCLFFDREQRVLLVEPTYKDVWDLPGGAVEADESPRAAAHREVLEELGLDRNPGTLLVLDWVPQGGEFTEVIALLFDGGVLSDADVAALRPEPSEIRSVRFVTLTEASSLVDLPTHNRIVAAVAARSQPGCGYLENGLPATE